MFDRFVWPFILNDAKAPQGGQGIPRVNPYKQDPVGYLPLIKSERESRLRGGAPCRGADLWCRGPLPSALRASFGVVLLGNASARYDWLIMGPLTSLPETDQLMAA